MLAVRQTDMSAGRCGAAPKPAMKPSSANVLIGGLKPMLDGDYWNSHKKGDTTHKMYCAQGSSNVICNGKRLVFSTAKLSCGDIANTGCQNVYVN